MSALWLPGLYEYEVRLNPDSASFNVHEMDPETADPCVS